jgi:hypothetical protein
MKTKMRERYDSISSILDGFSFARLQEFGSLTLTMNEFDISNGELREWLRFMRSEGTKVREREEKTMTLICPMCGDDLVLIAVNSMSCNQVGGGYNSMFSCADDMRCGYTMFDAKNVQEWQTLINRMTKQGSMAKAIKNGKGCGGCGNK